MNEREFCITLKGEREWVGMRSLGCLSSTITLMETFHSTQMPAAPEGLPRTGNRVSVHKPRQ